MKLPLEERVYQARVLAAERTINVKTGWPSYWSRDDQLVACAEGWCLYVINMPNQPPVRERIANWEPPPSMGCKPVFANNQEAVAYVMQRAQKGSDLHCRALVLHMADRLKNGE